jgi:hypothetical protein
MTRTCQPASAILPPELAPIKVGLYDASVSYLRRENNEGIPEANGNVSRIHAILRIVLLNLVQVLQQS